MRNNKILYPILLLLVVFSSCDYENPLDEEQYKKVAYLVGAYDNLLIKELPYSGEEQEAFISVGMSGSLLNDKDITVELSSHNSVIDWYNTKFLYLSTDLKYQALESNYYSVPTYSTVLKAGEAYARLPFKIRTEGLQCDSLYALTFKIKSMSDYEYNTKDSALIVSFNFVNNYSGSYTFRGIRHTLNDAGETTASASINAVRTLKATDEHSVRFYHEQQAETVANIKDYGIVLSLNADNNTVTVTAWKEFKLLEGTCTYDKANKVFDINYKYNLGGTTYQMEGTFTYLNKEDEE